MQATAAIAVFMLLGLAACTDRNGPAEELGERIDDAAEEAGERLDDAADELEEFVEQVEDAKRDN